MARRSSRGSSGASRRGRTRALKVTVGELVELEGLLCQQNATSLTGLQTILLVDRPENRVRFFILGSASPAVVRNVSETLAGRVEFVHLSEFVLRKTGADSWERLSLRGGFPRLFLARGETDSLTWRENFIQTSHSLGSPSPPPPCADSGRCSPTGSQFPVVPGS